MLSDVLDREGGPSDPSSLDASETTDGTARPMTASQHRLHARTMGLRLRVLGAFENSAEEAIRRRAARIDSCARFPRMLVMSDGRPGLTLNRCRDRACPTCASIRGRQLAASLAHSIQRMNAPRLLTLTVRSEPGEPLAAVHARLRDGFRAIRKTYEWQTHVEGGVYTIETTRNTATGAWHPHLHVVYDGRFWPQSEIADVWERVTGNSRIVDIRAVNDRAATAKYVADYVAKPWAGNDWSDDDLCEWASAMHRQRLSHAFGSLHGTNVDPSDEETTPKACDDLGATWLITEAANRGHRVASRIVDIAARMGSSWRIAFGLEPNANAGERPDETEQSELVTLAESFRADWFREHQPTPPPQPRPQDPYLFALHDLGADGLRNAQRHA